MATRNISLTEHFDRYIEEAVASGRYQNASEVVRDSLRLHEERERERERKLAALQAAIQVAEDDIAHGRFDVITSEEELGAHMDRIWNGLEAEWTREEEVAAAPEPR